MSTPRFAEGYCQTALSSCMNQVQYIFKDIWLCASCDLCRIWTTLHAGAWVRLVTTSRV